MNKTSNLTQLVGDQSNNIIQEFDDCMLKGSGWYFMKVNMVEIRLKGGMYFEFGEKSENLFLFYI